MIAIATVVFAADMKNHKFAELRSESPRSMLDRENELDDGGW